MHHDIMTAKGPEQCTVNCCIS